MRAVVQETYGPEPDVLELRDDVEKPAVSGERDVLVRVRAAGLDQGVWHLMAGAPAPARLVLGLRRPKVAVRGWDFAGHVEAVGSGVTRVKPGDAVFGSSPSGSFAEFTCAQEDQLATAPANLDLAHAAALAVSGVTALQGYGRAGNLEPGKRVLVIGAGGGVGSFAVKLAKAEGADVTGVCSTSKLDFVRSIGADRVVDYTTEDVTAGGDRFDLIVDTAGGRSLRSLRRILAPEGALVVVGAEVPGLFGGLGRPLRGALTAPFTSGRFVWLFATVKAPDLETLRGLVDAGALTPAVTATYPLAEVPQAIRDLRAGKIKGKAVILVEET